MNTNYKVFLSKLFSTSFFNIKTSLLLFSLLVSINVFAQPANDGCSNATTLSVGAACTNGTNLNATATGASDGFAAQGSCWTGGSAYSHSVFYKFVATDDSITIKFGSGTLGTDLYAAVYSGVCGSLSQLTPNGSSCTKSGSDINLKGLTVGTTYYIMVDGRGTTTGTFCISAIESPPPPAGSGGLTSIFRMSACGLNYVQASNRITSRYAALPGTGLPTTLNISGIPATCRVIEKAYLFYVVSYNAGSPVSPTITVNNPAGATFTYTAALVGQDGEKCWGEDGTRSFRTDVTSSITGNGGYIVNTTSPASEIDGMTLFIIYRDINATYQGHIALDNGIITINSFSTASHTLTGMNVCAASSGSSFLLAGDFQFATHTNTATGASTTLPVDNFWNFDVMPTNFTAGQTSVTFTQKSNYLATADCFSMVMAGTYYQTTTCATCIVPLTVPITPTHTTCGLNNGAATATPSTAIYAPYTYTWTPGGMATQTITGLAPGTYSVTITDPSGCKTASNTVTINPSTPVSTPVAGNNGPVCVGSPLNLTSNTIIGATYSWTGPAGFTSILEDPTVSASATLGMAGTYSVTATISGCTSLPGTTNVVVNPLPNVSAGADKQLTCSATTVILNGSSSTAGATFSWAGAGIVSGGTTATPTVNAAGTYTLTVTASGCTNTDAVVVSINTTIPNANAGADQTLTCSATTVVLNGSSTTAGATFSWTGAGIVSGGTTATPTVNAAGTYTLTVTDPANGCTATDGVVVNSNTTPPNANAGADQTITCSATTVVLNGSSSTAGATFSWAGAGIVSGGATATPTVNAAGTYTLTVTNPTNGCTATDQVIVSNSSALPNANAGTDQTITCSATTVVLNGSSTTAGATFSWAGAGIVSGGTTATPTVNAAGTYTLTVTNPTNGCTSTDQVIVSNSSALPNANAGTDKTLTCATTSVVLNGSSSTAGATFSWAGAGIVSGGATATPTVNAAGTYTLTVTNPTNGCTSTDQVIVSNSSALPNANAGADQTLTCSATTVVLNGSSTTAGATFSWTGAGIVSGGTTATPTVNAAGTYTLTVTDPTNGCTATDGVVVNSNTTLPNANAGADQTISCSSTTVILNGSSSTAGATFSWAGAGIVSGGTTATPTVNAAGTYTLTVTNPTNGCTSTDQVIVSNSSALPNANAGTDQTITCSATTVVLNGSSSTAGATFSWAGPGIVSGGNTATPTVNGAGTYTLTVTDPANGCTATDQVIVSNSSALPNANAGTDQTITCSATTVVLNGSSTTAGATFSWAGAGIVSGGTTATPTVNAAGTYTLTVTDPANGCSSTDQVIVSNSSALPNANAGADQTITCSATTVVLNGSSSTAGATFSWAGAGIVSGGATATPTVNAAGTYTLTVTDPANGCSSTDQVIVSNSSATPNVNAGADQTITCASTSVVLNGSSSTAGATFSWAGPSIVSGGNTATPTVNGAGTYTLTVTDPANGCTATDQAVVTPSAGIPNVNAGADMGLTCTTTSVILNGSSSTAGATFSWAGPGIVSGGATSTPTVNSAGTYTLTVTDPSNGCSAVDQATVNSNTLAPNANAGTDQTLTCTATTVVLNGSSSTAGATYSWSGPGIVSGGTTATPTVNAGGFYNLTVTDPANGCTSTDQAAVSANITSPIANAGADQILTCSATTVNLDGTASTAGASYSWTGPGITSGSSTNSATANAAGTYTLTVTNPTNGCTAADQVVVNSNTITPNANAGTDQTLTCASPTVTLNGSSTTPSVTYSWSGPSSFTSSQQAPSTSVAGTYTLTVTDPVNGCTAQDQVIVTPSAGIPNANAGADQTLTCTNTTVVLNGSTSTAGGTFSWGGPGIVSGGTTATPTINAAGTYTLTVTDPANGCAANDQVVVNTNTTAPIANAGADKTITCSVTSVILDGSSSSNGMTYSWSGPGGFTASAQSATATASGTYTITVTDPSNGCSASDEVIVSPSTGLPNVNAGNDQVLTCTTTSVTLTGSSTSSVTFSWTGPGITSGASSANASANAAGSYTLTVTDPANGCSASDIVNVTSNTTAPTANAGTDKTITCTVNSATLDGSLSSAGMLYSWNGPGGFTAATPTTSTTTAGTYTLTVTDPANGCSSTDNAVVSIAAGVPTANAGNDQLLTCLVTSVTLDGSSSSSAMTYSWSGPAGFTSATQSASATQAGTYTITVTNPANGCSAVDQVVVTSNTVQPTITITTSNPSICLGTSAVLNATAGAGNYSFSWSPATGLNNSTIANPTATPLVTTTYTLTVTDLNNGCSASNSLAIVVKQQPRVNFTVDKTSGCFPVCVNFDNLTLDSTGASVTYLWNFGDGTTSNLKDPATKCYAIPGTYTVSLKVIIDDCDSTMVKNSMITVSGYPTAEFSFGPQPTTLLNPQVCFTNLSSNATSWEWNFADVNDNTSAVQNPCHTYSDTGSFCAELIVQNIAGCRDTMIHCVEITPEFSFYVPNSFTPNNDLTNDVFMPVGENIEKFEMWIFDRWGNMIFKSDDINKGWDGKVQNGPSDAIAQIDVYVYKINLTDNLNKKRNYIGHVSLIR